MADVFITISLYTANTYIHRGTHNRTYTLTCIYIITYTILQSFKMAVMESWNYGEFEGGYLAIVGAHAEM